MISHHLFCVDSMGYRKMADIAGRKQVDLFLFLCQGLESELFKLEKTLNGHLVQIPCDEHGEKNMQLFTSLLIILAC